MKHAGIFSGGGGKGSFQIGACQVLRENGIKFDAVSGISVGALNASLIAQEKFEVLEDLWRSVGDSEGGYITTGNLAKIKGDKLVPDFEVIKKVIKQGISNFEFIKAFTSTLFKGKDLEKVGLKILDNLDYAGGLLDNTPLAQVLHTHIIRDDFKIPYYFGLTALGTSKGWELNNKDFASNKDLANAILASATMPVIWNNVPFIQTKKGVITESVDGGLRTVSPIGQVFDVVDRTKDDWTFWVINCNSKNLPAMEDVRRNSVRVGRTLDILLNQVFNDDIDRTLEINNNAEALGKRKVTINIIEPETGTIGSTLDFRKETMEMRIEMGRVITSNFFNGQTP